VSLNRRNTVLLVCAQVPADLEQPLKAAGCDVITATDGEAAVARARRQRFDLAVLASTGKTMDLMETVFNLRDIRYSLPILVVRDSLHAEPSVSVTGVRYCSERDLRSAVQALSPSLE
jgi:DNA-binding response OmpR family regulator